MTSGPPEDKRVKNSRPLPIPKPTSRWHWRLKLAPDVVTLVQRTFGFWLEPTIVASRSKTTRPKRAATETFVGVAAVASSWLSVLALLGWWLGMPGARDLRMDPLAAGFRILMSL